MCKYEEALQCGRRAFECLPAFKGFREEQEFYYMYSLTLLALCKSSRLLFTNDKSGESLLQRAGSQVCSLSVSEEECGEHMNIVMENQKKLKQYSDVAPMNYRHQFLLVEAELARVR